jgi:signal transduction histidine kinase/CHASE1-domain containing sensor protein
MALQSRANKGVLLGTSLQVLILTMGVVFTYFQQIQHQQTLDTKVLAALNNELTNLSVGINNRMELYQYGLFGLKGFIQGIGIENLNYNAIKRYSNARDYAQEFPGANGVGYIKKVTQSELSSFIAKAKSERPDTLFNFKTLSENKSDHFVIQYIFPENNNKQAIGLDIGSETIRKRAALNAVFANAAQLSAPITLVQADKKAHHGFLILLPIYNSKITSASKDERLEALHGWAYSPLLIDNILNSLFDINENYLSISDLNDATNVAFFTYGDKTSNTEFKVSTVTNVIGRQWQITLHGSHAFIENLHLPYQYQALVNGIFLTLIAMLIVLAIQLQFFRKAQKENLRRETEQAHKNILEQANLKLETDVKLRTQQIADISMLQRSILDSASYSIIATDINGLITEFNPAAEKLLGYKANDVVGKKTCGIFHLETELVSKAKQLSYELNKIVSPGLETLIVKATPTEPDVNQWTYVDSKGRHIQVSLSVTSLLNNRAQVVGFLGIAFDLTQQIKHEQALAHAKELAEQSAKTKSEFLANMSHEIRTPMNGILGTLQLLQEQPMNEKSTEFLKKALYSTRSLTTIINDILDFSKIEAGKLTLENKSFELDELIHHLESDLLVPAQEKNIYLQFKSTIEHKYWCGDAVRIRQVFLNLIYNAIKFTHKGGVTVEFKLTENEQVCVIVSDTGIGIPQNVVNRLFERFEQAESSTTREYGGTGLGLPITKSLINLMGGDIKVTSKEGIGSQFYVYLPLEKAQKALENETLNDLALPDLTNKVILVAEDNKINQLVVSAMLEPTGAHIVIANNGQEAVELYKERLPSIILMDIQMPKMDGFEACKIIKKIDESQIIIALTANVLSEQKRLYEALFDGYVSKPIEKQKLINALHVKNSR